MSKENKPDFSSMVGENFVVGENFNFTNHNETDYSSFRDFQKTMDERFASVKDSKSLDVRKQRLEIWDGLTPARWKSASLTKVEPSSANLIKKLMIADKDGSYFITGAPGAGKTYAAYAVMRKLIGVGKVAPSQVKIISEETIMSYAFSGFVGQAKFDELFTGDYKAYIIDNVASKDEYNSRKEIPFLEQLIQHIYTNSYPTVFTSNVTLKSFREILNESGDSKMDVLVGERVVSLKNRASKSDNKQNNATSPEKNILDKFSD